MALTDLNMDRAVIGMQVFLEYLVVAKLDKTEAKQPYTVTDAICSLMHFARSRGFDAEALARSAMEHYAVETTVCEECGGMGDPDQHVCRPQRPQAGAEYPSTPDGSTLEQPAERLEYLRGELRAERISYAELHELQTLAEHIEDGDVELLEAAGVPEGARGGGTEMKHIIDPDAGPSCALFIATMNKKFRLTAIFDNDAEANAYMATHGGESCIANLGPFVLIAKNAAQTAGGE